MDLKFPQKSLLERVGFPFSKKVAFLAVAGLVVVIGAGLRVSHYFGGTPAKETAPAAVEAPKSTPAPAAETAVPEAPPATQNAATPPAAQDAPTAPATPAEQAGDAAEQAPSQVGAVEPAAPLGGAPDQTEQAEGVDPSVILVSKRPVEVLSSPSATAPAMFGFPAGRPFRVIGREGGFIRIKDLRSGASGWIEEAALAPAKQAEPEAAPASPSSGGGRSATTSAGSKPKATKKDTQVTSDSADEVKPVETQKRPGLFGKGGLFGGIFGGN